MSWAGANVISDRACYLQRLNLDRENHRISILIIPFFAPIASASNMPRPIATSRSSSRRVLSSSTSFPSNSLLQDIELYTSRLLFYRLLPPAMRNGTTVAGRCQPLLKTTRLPRLQPVILRPHRWQSTQATPPSPAIPPRRWSTPLAETIAKAIGVGQLSTISNIY